MAGDPVEVVEGIVSRYVAAERERVLTILGLCDLAGAAYLAAAYIEAGSQPGDVLAELRTLTRERDGSELRLN